MATWLVQHSQLHPAFRSLPVMYGMDMGGEVDPTTERTSRRFEGLILQVCMQLTFSLDQCLDFRSSCS